MLFYSITHGILSFAGMLHRIQEFIAADNTGKIIITVGTDSQVFSTATKYVTVVAVYRQGKGGQFYRSLEVVKGKQSLQDRIYRETTRSIEIAGELKYGLRLHHLFYDIEIHLDCGENGESRQLIQQLTGWVKSCGYTPRIKPESYTASTIADKYTKSL